MQKYVVTCEGCKGHDTLTISPQGQVFYEEQVPIISARFRPDGKWGFECTCGQDSRISPEEKNWEKLVRGSEHAIAVIKKSLTPKNELKFRMERV